MIYLFNLDPCPKPRQTQADRWKKRPRVMRYREFADQLRAQAGEQSFQLPGKGAEYQFGISMPASWSEKKRKRMDGTPHEQKPDLDNLLKAVWDALLGEDCAIWHIERVQKVWSRKGYIGIRIHNP